MLIGFYAAAAVGFYAWMLRSATPEEDFEATHPPKLRVIEGGLSDVAAGDSQRAA